MGFGSRRRWPSINLSGGDSRTCCNSPKDSSKNWVSNYLIHPKCSSITTNESICTFIESNIYHSIFPRSNVAIGIPLDDNIFTELPMRSDDKDKEAFINGDRPDVWDETLGSYSDE